MSRSEDLIDQLADLWLGSLADFGSRERPVVEFSAPARLRARIGEYLALSLDPDDGPATTRALLGALKTIVELSVHTDHPRFFNQNFAGSDAIAVIGDAFGALLNTTNATFEAAPVFTLLERELTARMAQLAGFRRADAETQDPAGIFCPGGSTANLYAMQLARHRAHPEVLEEGSRGGPDLVAFTSTHAHYSIDKGVRLLGLGKRALVQVRCDPSGAMRMDALEEALEACLRQGRRPFFINASAGTTVTAAFDSIEQVVRLGRRHDTWVHVDGAVGGGALFSTRERDRLRGVGTADSMTWNLHKLSGATQQCSVLLVSEPAALRTVFSTKADYLFQADKNHRELDTGDLTFQCARRNDALKAWLMWKARGEAALGARVDHAVDLARRLEAWVEASDDFAMAAPRVFTNVCFWWVPPELRGRFDPQALTAQERSRLHALAPKVKDHMQREGRALVGYQPIDGGPNAWRMIFINPAVTWDDVEETMQDIARYSQAALAAV